MNDVFVTELDILVPSIKMAEKIFEETLGLEKIGDNSNQGDKDRNFMTFKLNEITRLNCWEYKDREEALYITSSLHISADKQLINKVLENLKGQEGFSQVNYFEQTLKDGKKHSSVHIITQPFCSIFISEKK